MVYMDQMSGPWTRIRAWICTWLDICVCSCNAFFFYKLSLVVVCNGDVMIVSELPLGYYIM